MASSVVKNDFSKGAMWRNILRMGLPMMLAQLINVLYSIVDRMYIGHMEGVGSLALTGLGLTMPLVSMIGAFAALCGTGGGPLCSIARGRGDLESAEELMGNAFALLLILGAVITAAFSAFLRPILFFFGATDATIVYAAEYARIYVLGTVFVMLALGMNYFINAQGFAGTGMLTVAVGAVINIVLDPIFIFALDMGIAGAAWATFISQACSAAWVLCFLLGKKAILKLRLRCMRLRWSVLGKMLALGITGFVMQFTNGVVQIACNVELRAFGGDLFVGAMTVLNSVREVLFMIIHGLSNGAQPVLGFNYGAGKPDRVRQGIRFMTAAAFAYAALATAVTQLFPAQLTMVFNDDPALLAICEKAMRIYFCAFLPMSFQVAGQCVFVALGRAKQAIIFSVLRKVVIVTPLIFLLPRIPALGVYGVFWSEPISDIIGGAACYITMYFTVYRPLGRAERKETGA